MYGAVHPEWVDADFGELALTLVHISIVSHKWPWESFMRRLTGIRRVNRNLIGALPENSEKTMPKEEPA